MEAIYYLKNDATKNPIFRLTNKKPLNKFFWEKEKAIALEKLALQRNIEKEQIKVSEL